MHLLLPGFREFRARPWVSGVAVLTLALGIAGATTMFAMLGAMGSMMVPPGVDAARVGRIAWTSLDENGVRSQLTAEEYVRVKADAAGGRAGASAFEALSASADESLVLGDDGASIPVKRISADFFRTFGFAVSAGRALTAQDEREGRAVALVSEAFRRRSPSHGLGKTIRLGGSDFTIVGVVPDRHWFPVMGGPDAWLPLPVARDGTPLASFVTATVRLRSPAALDAARSQLSLITRRLEPAATLRLPRKLTLFTLKQDVGKRTGFGLVGLLGPSIVVLLIACGNVANLLLARAAGREREMAVRAALGAGRMRLVRERLAESSWLAFAGGGVGVALAVAAVRCLRAWVGSFEESRTAAEAIGMDLRALAFALAVTTVIPFVFGLVPAWAASRPNLLGALHQSAGRRKPRRGPYGGRDLLVIVEVGLAVVLVVCAGMFTRFFSELGRLDWGFDPTRVLSVELTLKTGAADRKANAALADEVLEAIRRVPGVQHAASGWLAGGGALSRAEPIEFENCAAAPVAVGAVSLRVGPDYFATLGLAVHRGRPIGREDVAGSPLVGVVSLRHAERCWPGQDPIGRRFRLGRAASAAWGTIVGVAGDTMTTRVFRDMPQPVYLPAAQAPDVPSTLLVRAAGDPPALAGSLRAAIRRVDRTQPAERIERVDESVRKRLGGTSLITGILGAFGGFALMLAALGVFSVVSYMVAERTREFGIRVALGASRRDILWLVVRQAVVIVTIGAAVSIAATLAVTRAAFLELAQLAATDLLLWSLVSGVLALVALGATITPARRATRVEPVVALRSE